MILQHEVQGQTSNDTTLDFVFPTAPADGNTVAFLVIVRSGTITSPGLTEADTDDDSTNVRGYVFHGEGDGTTDTWTFTASSNGKMAVYGIEADTPFLTATVVAAYANYPITISGLESGAEVAAYGGQAANNPPGAASGWTAIDSFDTGGAGGNRTTSQSYEQTASGTSLGFDPAWNSSSAATVGGAVAFAAEVVASPIDFNVDLAVEVNVAEDVILGSEVRFDVGVGDEANQGLNVVLNSDRGLNLGAAIEVDSALDVVLITVTRMELGVAGEADEGFDVELDRGLDQPQNLDATALSSSTIRLTWDDIDGETEYRIERTTVAP